MPLYLPLILPLAVLALPLFDLVLAVLRRLRRGQSPFAPDKEHLHHRLMDLGHSHRRAVLLLYFWSAVLAFGATAMSISKGPWLVLGVVAALFAAGVLATAVPRLRWADRAPAGVLTRPAGPGGQSNRIAGSASRGASFPVIGSPQRLGRQEFSTPGAREPSGHLSGGF